MTAIEKALNVLDALEAAPSSGRSLAELAETTQLPKPTLHRLLATLEERGYARRTATGRHALGPRLISLGQVAAAGNTLQTASAPVLDRLVAECNETVHLGVLQGESLLYIDRREPDDVAVRLATLPSPLSSLHASASGKVLLAYADDALVDRVLSEPLQPHTESTIVDPERLRRELATVREQGFAVNEQERFVGVRAVAVPVRGRDGTVLASLSVAGPAQRLGAARVEELRTRLTAAAEELSARLA